MTLTVKFNVNNNTTKTILIEKCEPKSGKWTEDFSASLNPNGSDTAQLDGEGIDAQPAFTMIIGGAAGSVSINVSYKMGVAARETTDGEIIGYLVVLHQKDHGNVRTLDIDIRHFEKSSL